MLATNIGLVAIVGFAAIIGLVAVRCERFSCQNFFPGLAWKRLFFPYSLAKSKYFLKFGGAFQPIFADEPQHGDIVKTAPFSRVLAEQTFRTKPDLFQNST